MVEYVGEKTRHHCLNPKCRCKLPTPVSNAEAFCCRGQLQAVAAFTDFGLRSNACSPRCAR